jgi:fermentation-respiration switch protein FrsA (DUF1100 family)
MPRAPTPNQPRWAFVLRAVVAGVALLASVYVLALASLQRRLLFPRPSLVGAPARPTDAEQVWLRPELGAVEAWYLPPTTGRARPSAVLVFFHGNGELIDGLPRDFSEPRAWGVGVLLVELPGYGRSAGEPSQQTVSAVALAAADWVPARFTSAPPPIVAYGRSLGGAAAAILAANRGTAALVLESTFTSVRSFAHGFGVPELVVKDPFDTLSLVASYAHPLLVLHGEHDRLIPPSHARELADAAPQAELHFLRCGHNDCVRPWPTLQRFLQRARLLGE